MNVARMRKVVERSRSRNWWIAPVAAPGQAGVDVSHWPPLGATTDEPSRFTVRGHPLDVTATVAKVLDEVMRDHGHLIEYSAKPPPRHPVFGSAAPSHRGSLT